MKPLIHLCFTFFILDATAQLVTPEWIDSVPGHYGFGADIEVGPDGFLYSAGCVSLQADYNQRIALIKNDKDGNRIWMFQADTNIAGNIGKAHALTIGKDGYIYVAGSRSAIQGNDEDMWVYKIDTGGNVVWDRRYDGPAGNHDQANDVAVDDSNNVYITGTRNNINNFREIVTIKYDAAGNLQWSRFDFVNNTSSSMGSSEIKVDALGNVYVAGKEGYFISPSARSRALLLSYDLNGNVRWRKTYNPVNNLSSDARSVEVDDLFNSYISGAASDNSAYIIKFDSSGNQRWSYNYPGAYADDLVLSPNGILYMSGCWRDTTHSGRCDMLLAKIDSAGNPIWDLTKGGNRNNWDYGMNIALGKNDEVYLSGVFSDSVLIDGLATLKYDSSGNLQWIAGFPDNSCLGPNSEIGSAVDDSNNVYLTSFFCQAAAFVPTFCTFRYGSLSLSLPEISAENNFTIFPNPVSEEINIQLHTGKDRNGTLKIFDISGKIRKSVTFSYLPYEANEFVLGASELESGFYIFQVELGNQKQNRRFIVLR